MDIPFFIAQETLTILLINENHCQRLLKEDFGYLCSI